MVAVVVVVVVVVVVARVDGVEPLGERSRPPGPDDAVSFPGLACRVEPAALALRIEGTGQRHCGPSSGGKLRCKERRRWRRWEEVGGDGERMESEWCGVVC